jgi:hypothetical protein
MFSILALLFAFRGGPDLPRGPPEPVTMSVRAEALAAAAESELGPAALLEAERDLAMAPRSPEWPVLPSTPGPSTPGAAPIFRAQRPEEWISIVSGQLHLEDNRITKAAIRAAAWVVAMPVRVDITPRRVCVTVRVATF